MPLLTREGSLFDARPEAFGSYRVLDEMRPGRFGRVYLAQEPATGAFVVVKVCQEGVSPQRAPIVAAALARVCEAPLDHPSLVAPLAAGLQDDLPWIAEPQVDGELLDAVIGRGADVTVPDVLVRVTQIAGALDFAAAAGIRHGALHPRSIIISGERTLLTGLGIQQALVEAGIDAPMHDDVPVLAAIAGEWLAGKAPAPLHAVLESAVSGGHRGTALDLAAAMQSALSDPQSAVRDPQPVVHDPLSAIRTVEPDTPHVADPDLRITEPEPRFADVSLQSDKLRIAERGSRMAEPRPRITDRRSPSLWPPMAAMLAIGLLGGFAAGFIVGQRDATPVPHSAERAVRRSDAPAPTTGRDGAEAEIPTDVREPEVRLPRGTANADPRTLNQEPKNPEPGTRNLEPGAVAPAALVVDSRPRGARVFLDGRLVGQTPLSLPEVSPGEHAVRIDLIGYRRWATTINAVAGERTRVAASLER